MKTFQGWGGLQGMSSKQYTCWNCGNLVSSVLGYNGTFNTAIYICPHCKAPHIITSQGNSILDPNYGKSIKKLPNDIENVYEEARRCMSINAYTSVIMLMRKLLMHLGVQNGASNKFTFAEHVDYLCANGFVHIRQKGHADKVRSYGNEANHEIVIGTKESAEESIKFMEFLLLNLYEFADDISLTEPKVIIKGN